MSPQKRIALQIEINRAHGRELLKGVADYALSNADWRLELVDAARLADAAFVRQFDGLIVRVMDDVTSDALMRAQRPAVDTYGRTDSNPIASIRLDDKAIAEVAFDFFASLQYATFAYCGFDGLRFSDMRKVAFRARVEGSGGSFMAYACSRAQRITDAFFRNERTDAPDADALGRWLRALPKPVALFCCNDVRAVQVLQVCSDCGINVPTDVAVLGVDNDVLLCTFANPSLSSVETDSFALGRRAAQMLDCQMHDTRDRCDVSGKPIPVALHLPTGVVERISTDAYPFKTPWLGDAVRFIRRNLAKGVTADDVVRHVGYSHPTVNRAFISEMGHSVKREILLRRNQQACSLLRHSALSVAEISARCGFQTPQYFSHYFSKIYGLPPESWRMRLKKSI